MATQIYIVTLRGGYTPESSRDVQRLVRGSGGYILMVTRTGPVIAIDDSRAPVVARNPLVEFLGPVTLNPNGVAAGILTRIFAENLSKQIEGGASSQPGPNG
jgi:hypothetical protein